MTTKIIVSFMLKKWPNDFPREGNANSKTISFFLGGEGTCVNYFQCRVEGRGGMEGMQNDFDFFCDYLLFASRS